MLHCPRSIMRNVAYSGLFLTLSVASALAADPTGDWKVADGVADIRIAECNGNMWGVVQWEKVPGGRDTHNPDASKQSRPTLGMPILIEMKKKAGVRSVGRPSLQCQGRPDLQFDDQAGRSPTSWKYRAACSASCVAARPGRVWRGPIPSSPVNSMAKSGPKSAGSTAKTAAPRTVGAAKPPAQKQAGSAAHPADPIGDICLLPDIAGFAH